VPPECVRADYAGNSGSSGPFGGLNYLFEDERGPGPDSVRQGDDKNWWNTMAPYSFKPLPNGVFFQRSKISRGDITRGLSNVYLLGERYINPKNYFTGEDPSDNESFYAGWNNDICRTSAEPPLQDTAFLTKTFAFGSAHNGGFQMSFCDGSIRFIEYNIKPAVHSLSGIRFAQ
jgi:prepilin-type processing-associated H-X9-DG protein